VSATTADVAVIGAGIMGASCAYQLAARGMKVVVLEQAEAPATGATGKSLAGVRVQFTTEDNIRMSWLSIQTYRDFERLYGEDVGYRPIGYLLLVPPDGWEAHLEGVALQKRVGVPVEVVDLEDAQRWLSFETAGLAGATFGPVDGIVDPHMAAHAWVTLGKARGVEYRVQSEVSALSREGSGWRLRAGAETIDTGHVVNAAGAWSGRVAALAGLELPVHPQRKQVFLTSPVDDPRTYPLTIDTGSGFYLRSEGDRLLVGMSDPNQEYGFVEGLDEGWLLETLQTGSRRFPWLADVGIDMRGSWWGYYAVTPDHNPIIGRHPGTVGWVDATGFSGHGIMHAPITGILVAEIICDGAAWTVDTTAYRHGRFAAGVRADTNIY
jgi:sarcosine oxidase subunit beta